MLPALTPLLGVLAMAAVDLSPLISNINFGFVSTAILSVAALLITVFALLFAVAQVVAMVKGDKVEFGGRMWTRDVYDTAMRHVHSELEAGRYVDRESKNAFRNYLIENPDAIQADPGKRDPRTY